MLKAAARAYTSTTALVFAVRIIEMLSASLQVLPYALLCQKYYNLLTGTETKELFTGFYKESLLLLPCRQYLQ